ncbi:hypothetical protein HMPREF9548_01786 [Escherichia coli MS 182-1]|nr:hypothetical protein HMPREF9548_01786 [Escherichia coli MS 182-1]
MGKEKIKAHNKNTIRNIYKDVFNCLISLCLFLLFGNIPIVFYSQYIDLYCFFDFAIALVSG